MGGYFKKCISEKIGVYVLYFFVLVQGLVVGSSVQSNELLVPEKAGNCLTSWTTN